MKTWKYASILLLCMPLTMAGCSMSQKSEFTQCSDEQSSIAAFVDNWNKSNFSSRADIVNKNNSYCFVIKAETELEKELIRVRYVSHASRKQEGSKKFFNEISINTAEEADQLKAALNSRSVPFNIFYDFSWPIENNDKAHMAIKESLGIDMKSLMERRK